MKCISCESFSFKIICKSCQKKLLKPQLSKRVLQSGLEVYSFYKYDEIKDLVNTKYQIYGSKVLGILAKLSIKEFAQSYHPSETNVVIPIDDDGKIDFSHTAILAKSMQNENLTIQYNTLKAKNKIKYAGKDIKYRKKYKRDFEYTGKPYLQVILVDDIITTGSTLTQAQKKLEENDCKVLFALTLCDAQG